MLVDCTGWLVEQMWSRDQLFFPADKLISDVFLLCRVCGVTVPPPP